MKYLLVLCVISILLMFLILRIEERYITNLSDDHRFKRWWRKNVIGEE